MIRAATVAGVMMMAAHPVAAQQAATEASGVVLRALDKINGIVYDIEMATGQSAEFGNLLIKLDSCRFPVGNPAGDAFAALEITDAASGSDVFRGWMIASTPALSAMDNARYDIWVMRCTTS